MCITTSVTWSQRVKSMVLHRPDEWQRWYVSVSNAKRNPFWHRFVQMSISSKQQWNNELAYLAALHAIKCQFKHDNCRRTGTLHVTEKCKRFRWWQLWPISMIRQQIHSLGPVKILPFKCNRIITQRLHRLSVRCSTIGSTNIMSHKWMTSERINSQVTGNCWTNRFHLVPTNFFSNFFFFEISFTDAWSVISRRWCKTNRRMSAVRLLISKCNAIYSPFIWFVIMRWQIYWSSQSMPQVHRALAVPPVAMTTIRHCAVPQKWYELCRCHVKCDRKSFPYFYGREERTSAHSRRNCSFDVSLS